MRRLSGIISAATVICFVGLLVAVVCSSAFADDDWVNYVVNEDIHYWTSNGKQLVKVQQTVYNSDYTELLKSWEWPGVDQDTQGYLYAYSLTNLSVLHKVGNKYTGIKEFSLIWNVKPSLVLAPTGWTCCVSPIPLTGKWQITWNTTGQLMPGQTLGDLWAFANTSKDCITTGSVDNGSVEGETTGPVPEPAGFLAFATGIVGLFSSVILSRRK